MTDDARRFYADELRSTTDMRSQPLSAAFATVPRERFVGPGPWRIKSIWDKADEYRSTENDDPRHVYHDVMIALDEEHCINNGQPALWAFLLDRLGIAPGEDVLHLGCGTGYYTAIMAEIAGTAGRVTAIEIDTRLFARAREALAPWQQVMVIHANGADISLGQMDVIVASAGATHPRLSWLNTLKDGGRLLFPMTAAEGLGGMLLVTRHSESSFEARFLTGAAFIDFEGARDIETSHRLAEAFDRDRGAGVKSLRCDRHVEEETCWLHGKGWCLSRSELAQGQGRSHNTLKL